MKNINLIIRDKCPICDAKLGSTLPAAASDGYTYTTWSCPKHYTLIERSMHGTLRYYTADFLPKEKFLVRHHSDADEFDIYLLNDQNDMYTYACRIPSFFVYWDKIDKLCHRLDTAVTFS